MSVASEPLEVVADDRVVAITFTASPPEGTPAEDVIYIAGDFQGWDPAGTPMSPLDDSTWEITLDFEDASSLEYKYTRGSWEAVEKDAGCGEIPNRTATADYGADGTQQVLDVIELWRDTGGCG